MSKLRCFLVGTKDISVKILEEILLQGHEVLGVLSEDYKESMKIWNRDLGHTSLKATSAEYSIPVFDKININSEEMISKLVSMDLDIIFSVQGSQMIKETVLSIPRLGCFNLHTAFLPRNRGCFPMAWSIINNEKHSGITIHKMLPGVDDGPIVSQKKVLISKDETGKTLYKKVMISGFDLFRETLPLFEQRNFALIPQDGNKSSYNPCTNLVRRGYPFGGQANPYWSVSKKNRFKRALTFDPFPGESPEPDSVMENFSKPSIRVMLGFDCDRPRDGFISSEIGKKMAVRKLKSIQDISKVLNEMSIPRTFFICGHWLQSMAYKFGNISVSSALEPSNGLVEIADHSYSHNIVKAIDNRPDKIPLKPFELRDEFIKNLKIFEEILGLQEPVSGFRTPLGHFRGLEDYYELQDTIVKSGIRYVSSDLRGPSDSIFAPLRDEGGNLRQPYRYKNGLLEIPSVGWQDVVFSQRDYILKFQDLPSNLAQTYEEIITYYEELFSDAKKIVKETNRDFFVGLCLHPYDCDFYHQEGQLFRDINTLISDIGGSFCTYGNVGDHYNKNLAINPT